MKWSPRIASLHILVAALLVVVVSLPGCAALGLEDVHLLSVEEEWEMGRQLERELEEQLTLSNDEELLSYVSGIGERLVQQTDTADRDWRFHVVEEPEVNAFNVPGGLVYVFTGLIEEVDDAAEFVAVMAHEVAHGVARHGSELLTRQYGLALLADAVLGDDPDLIQEIVAQILAAGAIAQHSQDQEFEADDIGVGLMADAGYHPEGMVALLERLLELQEREPGTVEEFFATHPGAADRIDRVEAQIEERDDLADLMMDDEEFAAIQDRL